jgi:hypothetical protein
MFRPPIVTIQGIEITTPHLRDFITITEIVTMGRLSGIEKIILTTGRALRNLRKNTVRTVLVLGIRRKRVLKRVSARTALVLGTLKKPVSERIQKTKERGPSTP